MYPNGTIINVTHDISGCFITNVHLPTVCPHVDVFLIPIFLLLGYILFDLIYYKHLTRKDWLAYKEVMEVIDNGKTMHEMRKDNNR